MDIQKACGCYHIPPSLLEVYRRVYGPGALDHWSDQDLERLSLMMTLQDIGFTLDEVEAYMGQLTRDCGCQACLSMLERRRAAVLEQIHFEEKQLARLDYLRHKLQCQLVQDHPRR